MSRRRYGICGIRTPNLCYHFHMVFLELAPAIAAGLAIFLLGHLWYHARLFGRLWMRLTNLSPEAAERGKSRSFFFSVAGLVGALAAMAALSYLGRAIGVASIADGVIFSFFVWLGLIVPALVGQVLWEGKPILLFAINAGYWLVAFLIAAPILFV